VGTLTLPAPAPAGGRLIRLHENLPAVTVPSTVIIPEGTTSKRFTVVTSSVSASQSGRIEAEVDNVFVGQSLTVRPMGVSSLKLAPSTVVGGFVDEGTVNLECAAGPGPITVELSSTDPAVAAPVAASIVIPQGVKSQRFVTGTIPVQSKQVVKISARTNGTERTKSLSVISAAVVTPTSLAFHNQPVGVPSAIRTVVLDNIGAVAYSITGITVTGTQPKMFVPASDCPAILFAGASCRINVTFTPFSTGKKAAQLNIATSAKDVPLVVKMTGTGI
jgi:hypothetical protein